MRVGADNLPHAVVSDVTLRGVRIGVVVACRLKVLAFQLPFVVSVIAIPFPVASVFLAPLKGLKRLGRVFDRAVVAPLWGERAGVVMGEHDAFVAPLPQIGVLPGTLFFCRGPRLRGFAPGLLDLLGALFVLLGGLGLRHVGGGVVGLPGVAGGDRLFHGVVDIPGPDGPKHALVARSDAPLLPVAIVLAIALALVAHLLGRSNAPDRGRPRGNHPARARSRRG